MDVKQPDFAQITRDLITRHGYTKGELARLLGVTQPMIRKLELGRQADPRYSLGVRLVKLHSVERRRSRRRVA